MRGPLIIFLFLLSLTAASQHNRDSIDYVILKLLTKDDSWLYKYRFDPFSRCPQDEIDYINKEYGIDLVVGTEYRAIEDLKWDKGRIGKRKLKGKNKLHLPRRRPVSYVSYVRYLNEDKTLALIEIGSWADTGFRRSSGGGDRIILEFKEGVWTIKQLLGGFITMRPAYNTSYGPLRGDSEFHSLRLLI